MESTFVLKQENPKKSANIISKLFFTWMVNLFYKGTRKPLELHDLYKTLECDESKHLGNKLEEKWMEEVLRAKETHRRPSLLKAITRTFVKQYILYGISSFVMLVFLRSPQPIVLSWLIKQFQEDAVHDRIEMYASAGTLVAISVLIIFIMHHNTYGQSCVGMRVRIAVSSLVYRKILKLSKRSQGQTAAGQIVNLLSNDVQRFDLASIYLNCLWIMPFQLILVTYFMWFTAGISCLAGILLMMLCTLPLQGYLGKVASSLRLKVAERTDARVKLMSEIVSGIQVIKMYAWEKPFEKMIHFLRLREVSALTKTSYLRGFYLSCMVFIERTTLFLTLVCFTLLGNYARADIVFSLAQFFNILQYTMAIMYPMAISLGAETWVSIKRLEEFLVMDEKHDNTVKILDKPNIAIKGVSASWVPGNIILNNIHLHVPKGSLCAVIGPVGSGKSSLLQLLLGELPHVEGYIGIGSNISYASQEPWLFAASVRKNIMFGKSYDSDLYKEVTKVCALESDFTQLSHGDRTRVGERGVSLSGGQRARINLARAVYRQADIYLLDDPLSAVDTHVGKHLFEECIVNYLGGKTRILVTHQLQYLKKADFIVVLNEGRIEAIGTFQELSRSDLDFTKILASADETNEENDKKGDKEGWSLEKSAGRIRKMSTMSSGNESNLEQSFGDDEGHEISGLKGQRPFWDYIKSVGSVCFTFMAISTLLLSQTACTCADLWVALWTSQEETRHLNSTYIVSEPQNYEQVVLSLLPDRPELDKLMNNSKPDSSYAYNFGSHNRDSYFGLNFDDLFDKIQVENSIHNLVKTNIAMYVYGCLIILAIALTVARSILFFNAAMKASTNIHLRMFHCLLEAPMRFFDTNPSGRVLNRFSKDIGAIDEILPRVLMESVQILLVMAGVLVNVIVSNYYMVAAMTVLGFIFFKLRSWYVSSAKHIKHLEGIAKSPVFSHISSSLNGLATIRALKAENALIREFDEHQDIHTSAWFLTIMGSVSFGLWLDIICVIFTTCIAFGFVISKDYGQTQNSSLVGLALSQSLILTGMLQYGMRQTAEVVNQLTSVERALQYTKLENEGPFESRKGILPVLPWPSFGKIEFRKLSLYYTPDQAPVLKNLNLIIHSREKVGIVGRTGAGKSSLIAALFRLAPIKGKILIDDLDTSTVGLNDLRKKISIIPQEPVLFSATLRYNLDPFEEFQDNQLWAALEEVELKDLVTTLDFQVSERGSNFSVGQRQLLCLARALLRNNNILVLDEATANVDARTDGLIQSTIRKKFQSCTVLTIAHRLNTIMDSDKVIVMDEGRVCEFDHPHKLLQISDGYLTKLVLETGPFMNEQLRNISLKAWEERNEKGYDESDPFRF